MTETDSQKSLTETDHCSSAASWSKGLGADTLGNLAHELRTPIQVMTGLIEILREEYLEQLGDQPRAIVERMNVNICDLAQTLDNLMAYALLQAGGANGFDEEITINSILADISSTIEAANAGKHLDVIFDLKDAPLTIRAPRRITKSIILNLILNAIKFTETGSVNIAIRQVAKRNVATRRSANQIEIQISDTGAGLDPELLEQISQPFSQLSHSSVRRYRGLGLGLAIVRHNVAMLGGQLELQSSPGHGATFIVRFPAREKTTQTHAVNREVFPQPLRRPNYPSSKPSRANLRR